MQIKQLVSLKLNSLILLCVLLYPASFGTNIYCHVRGYIYYDGYELSSLDRSDLCTTINHKLEDKKIILWNDIQWVMIEIPDTVRGHTSFWYKWGSDNAYLNGKPVSVEWGYVLKG